MSAKRRLLLHICCAPDATIPRRVLASEGFDVTGFFYGNNIHPRCEWVKRRDAVRKLSSLLGMEAEIAAYSPEEWFAVTERSRGEPEGGARCAACFELQLGAAARRAAAGDFGFLCTTLTISPHKNPDMINGIGRREAGAAGVEWVERIWRKGGGFRLSVIEGKKMNLFRQNYCGCAYSARSADENERTRRRSA